MVDKALVSDYARAIKKLEESEAAYMSVLAEAGDSFRDHLPGKSVSLRLRSRSIERALEGALSEASMAHRAYWFARKDELMKKLSEVAALMAQYDKADAASGGFSHRPSLSVLSTMMDAAQPVDVVDEVPTEGPDSEVLGDKKGFWIGGGVSHA